jgi:hypothetical protein
MSAGYRILSRAAQGLGPARPAATALSGSDLSFYKIGSRV